MCFWDSYFPFRRLDEKSEFADSRKQKLVGWLVVLGLTAL